MHIGTIAKWLIPHKVRHGLKQQFVERINESVVPVGANTILGALYSSRMYELSENGKQTFSSARSSKSNGGTLPIPPSKLRMGHSDQAEKFIAAGVNSATWIRRIMQREGVDLTQNARVLDWGCATGRVLRHFEDEAQLGEFWGADESSVCIDWNKANLCPPFKFVTCTAYPHLPFEDEQFHLIYGLSVFTHVLHLMDMWLMEFRRILVPGGYACFSIHDEHTWSELSRNESLRRDFVSRGFWPHEDFSIDLRHDIEILAQPGNWGGVTTFFRTDWIAQEWGHYFEIVSFEPLCEAYQTVVVMRKAVGRRQ
jgi:SAM-dependent methyltransferase